MQESKSQLTRLSRITIRKLFGHTLNDLNNGKRKSLAFLRNSEAPDYSGFDPDFPHVGGLGGHLVGSSGLYNGCIPFGLVSKGPSSNHESLAGAQVRGSLLKLGVEITEPGAVATAFNEPNE